VKKRKVALRVRFKQKKASNPADDYIKIEQLELVFFRGENTSKSKTFHQGGPKPMMVPPVVQTGRIKDGPNILSPRLKTKGGSRSVLDIEVFQVGRPP